MATVTARGTTHTTTAGNKTVTATPAVGDLIVILCRNSGRTTANPPTITDNNSGGAGTYTRITAADFTKNASADTGWVFVRNSLVGSATSTVFTMTQSGDTGGGLDVFSVAGMSLTGSAAVRQAAVANNQAAGTPAVTFASALLTGNTTLGHVMNGTNSTTTTAPPTGWTESYDSGYNTPATGRESVFRNSGSTATTVTWGAASASAYGAAMVELDTTEAKSGSTSASHTSSTTASGAKARTGTTSASHTSATSVTGRKNASSAVTVAHTSSTSVTGGGSGSVALTHASATSATGGKAESSAITVTHTTATSATGVKTSNDFSGSFTVTHVSATATQGAKGADEAASIAHTSATSATGTPARAGTGAVAHASATSATGTHAGVGSVTLTLASSTASTGTKAASGTIAISHTSATAATGSAAEAHAGTADIAHTTAVAVQGYKGAASSIAAAHTIAVAVAAQRDLSTAIAIAHVVTASTEGVHDGRSAIAVAMASSVAVTGFAGQPVFRSHATVGSSVIGPGGHKASVGDRLVGAARLSVGGASTDGTTVGDS